MKSISDIGSTSLLGPKAKEGLKTLVPRSKSQQKTDAIAEYLVEKFNSPTYRPAFLRIAWRLEESIIYRMAEQAAQTGKVPRAYFITCARNEMRRRGVA